VCGLSSTGSLAVLCGGERLSESHRRLGASYLLPYVKLPGQWPPPGKPVKVREFDFGQGKVREVVVCLRCTTSVAIVTK